MKLQEKTIFQFFSNASVKTYEAINNYGIAPVHEKSVVLCLSTVSRRYLSFDLKTYKCPTFKDSRHKPGLGVSPASGWGITRAF